MSVSALSWMLQPSTSGSSHWHTNISSPHKHWTAFVVALSQRRSFKIQRKRCKCLKHCNANFWGSICYATKIAIDPNSPLSQKTALTELLHLTTLRTMTKQQARACCRRTLWMNFTFQQLSALTLREAVRVDTAMPSEPGHLALASHLSASSAFIDPIPVPNVRHF